MNFNPEEFGIKFELLYEILATSYGFNPQNKEIIPNTACMGVRLREDKCFIITPYLKSQTNKNLSSNKIVTLNLVDNIYWYALAALKKPKFAFNFDFFSKQYYHSIKNEDLEVIRNLIPIEFKELSYFEHSWGIIICQVVETTQREKTDKLGQIKLTEFIIKPIYIKKLSDSNKLFNRAENLALEMIILATRLLVAYRKNDMKLITSIKEKITDYEDYIEKFSHNEDVFKTIRLVNKYCSNVSNIISDLERNS